MILVLDNYDSFTYNLVQYLGELGATMRVARNDKITVDEIERLEPEGIVISPGVKTRPRFVWQRALITTWRAKWDFLLPVVPIVLIFGGFVLPVPAAAMTAAYAIAVAAFVNRDLPRGARLEVS